MFSASEEVTNRVDFFAKMSGLIFNEEELIQSNCAGTHGCKMFDQDKMNYLRDVVFSKFKCKIDENQKNIWRDLCRRLDAKHRNKKSYASKKLGTPTFSTAKKPCNMS